MLVLLQIEVDAYQDHENSPSSSAERSLFGMVDLGRMYSRRAARLSAHDGDEGIRARPIAAMFCSEATKSLLKKLLDDLEVG